MDNFDIDIISNEEANIISYKIVSFSESKIRVVIFIFCP